MNFHAISNITLLILVLLTSLLCFAILPLFGEILRRNKWHKFRKNFKYYTSMPFLNYEILRKVMNQNENSLYRFSGGFDSITDDNVMWLQSEANFTVPIPLKNALIYILYDDELRSIRWNKISTLTTGAKVFAGGNLLGGGGHPVIIFYECSEKELEHAVLYAGRQKSEYFNPITPYSLIAGIFFLLYIAFNFYGRPAYRLTVTGAILAMFSPMFPHLPPGLLLTFLHRKLMAKANKLRLLKDLKPSAIDERSSIKKIVLFESLSWFLLVAAIALNLFLVILLIIYINNF
ncbi:MAG: hypothetical protein Ta2G_04790 [Termitinemataceae bacterium]|nr:MAG: hypothetical protein Ta2G_04790 [Termitinemataceae bacterium]